MKTAVCDVSLNIVGVTPAPERLPAGQYQSAAAGTCRREDRYGAPGQLGFSAASTQQRAAAMSALKRPAPALVTGSISKTLRNFCGPCYWRPPAVTRLL